MFLIYGIVVTSLMYFSSSAFFHQFLNICLSVSLLASVVLSGTSFTFFLILSIQRLCGLPLLLVISLSRQSPTLMVHFSLFWCKICPTQLHLNSATLLKTKCPKRARYHLVSRYFLLIPDSFREWQIAFDIAR